LISEHNHPKPEDKSKHQGCISYIEPQNSYLEARNSYLEPQYSYSVLQNE